MLENKNYTVMYGEVQLAGLEVMASREAHQKPPQFSNNHNFPKIDPKDKN